MGLFLEVPVMLGTNGRNASTANAGKAKGCFYHIYWKSLSHWGFSYCLKLFPPPNSWFHVNLKVVHRGFSRTANLQRPRVGRRQGHRKGRGLIPGGEWWGPQSPALGSSINPLRPTKINHPLVDTSRGHSETRPDQQKLPSQRPTFPLSLPSLPRGHLGKEGVEKSHLEGFGRISTDRGFNFELIEYLS